MQGDREDDQSVPHVGELLDRRIGSLAEFGHVGQQDRGHVLGEPGELLPILQCFGENPAGAGGIFPEALKDREEFTRFAKDVPTILLANMTEFGETPYTTVEEFADMGYRLVIFPVTLQRAAMKAMEECLSTLRTEGSQRNLIDRMQTRQELYDLLDYEVDASRPTRPLSGEQP